MPKELIILGVALLVGAWFMIDQRSLKEKVGLIFILLVLYIGYQFLSGRSPLDLLSSLTQIFSNQTPSSPPPEE